MVCRARTISETTTSVSVPRSGMAAWVPNPVTAISNVSREAMMAPTRVAKVPRGRPGQLCSP